MATLVTICVSQSGMITIVQFSSNLRSRLIAEFHIAMENILAKLISGHDCILIIGKISSKVHIHKSSKYATPFFPDQVGTFERIATDLIISSLLSLPNIDNQQVKVLPQTANQFDHFSVSGESDQRFNCAGVRPVTLIHVAEYTQRHSIPELFHLVHRRVRSATRPLCLWVHENCLNHAADSGVIVAYLQQMAGAVLTIRDSENISILTKKGGGTTIVRKHFTYRVQNKRFVDVHEGQSVRAPNADTDPDTATIRPESLTTFKISVEDGEEMQARTALKLPYERTSDIVPKPQQAESRIIYHPDAMDDFDEEDPDDDLNI